MRSQQHDLEDAAGLRHLLVSTIPTSMLPASKPRHVLQGWLEGKPGGNPTHCDVRDVAAAHIRAAEKPIASGRYIVSHTSTSNPAEVGRWLQVKPSCHAQVNRCATHLAV
jgi:hypothetical protein